MANITRRNLVLAAASSALAPLAGAQEGRPIRLIVPTVAGGQPDIASRLLAQHLTGELNQPVLVENIAGAGGIPAISTILKAPPDGSYYLVADATHWAINPVLHKKLPYDPLKDLMPVRQITTTSLVFVTGPAVAVNNLKELIALAKSQPGKLTYGSVGVGSIHHLIMEAFKAATNVDILHIPYKGSGQSLPALMAGQISMTLSSFASVAPFVKDGKLKILGVTTKHRSAHAPDIPSMAEAADLADFDYPGGAALVTRAGTPPAVANRMVAALDKVINAPEVMGRFQTLGIEQVAKSSPAALAQLMQSDLVKYTRMAKVAGVTAES